MDRVCLPAPIFCDRLCLLHDGPNIEYLAGSGIAANWGVQVDDHLRTNFPDIYSAGDVIAGV